MSNNSTQRQAGSIDSNQTGFHYVKHHDYAHDEFAEQAKITQFNGIRVVDASDSNESEEFESFTELNQSDWTINGGSGARLSDGTILFEGQR